MTLDTRQNSRVKTSISCTFGPNQDTPRSGTVTSLSVSGCFVKTKGWVTKGDRMHLKLWLPEGRWLPLQGTVHYHLEAIGFGLLFAEVDSDGESKLKMLVSQGESPKPQTTKEEN